MNVLGLQAFYYNHASALLTDGRLAWFCEEEKLDRVKGAREGFPLRGIAAGLASAGISLDDVDEIAFPMEPWRYSGTLARSALGSVAALFGRSRGGSDRISVVPDRILSTARYLPPFLAPLIRQQIRHGGIPGRVPRVRCVPHHLAHAASAFWSSGMDEAAVVIVDGMGETECSTIWRGRDKSLERLDRVAFPNSLGEFYAAFTEYLGFRVYQQEGKLMGLAAYGGPDPELAEKMDRVIRIEDERYQIAPAYTIGGAHSFGVSYSDALVELFGEPRPRGGEITDRHRAIAWAAQDRLERAALQVVRRAVRLTGCRRVCFSGGVAMNCKLNGEILHSDAVDELFVLPASNDAGAALGAAMWRSMKRGSDPRFRLAHPYYGPGADDAQIEAALRNVKVPYRRFDPADPDEIVDLLADRKVVGLFTGRSEFGARALGARSILADPRHKEMWDIVNESVKRREKWRPFAPVILEGFEGDYFLDASPSRFMMKAFQVRPEKRDQIPAVVHVDGTCRPQSISREANPVYYDILSAFHRRTGVPVLMNTSFNVRGEPIVSSPFDALRCYLGTGMDALAIGSFLLRKDGAERPKDRGGDP
ncbi:MAG: carbamoyltransferase [Proteobacteria bacterium]|nr:carbamoyltransferase [Pseudomonadota bacterium]